MMPGEIPPYSPLCKGGKRRARGDFRASRFIEPITGLDKSSPYKSLPKPNFLHEMQSL
jgi:hypothetical protein